MKTRKRKAPKVKKVAKPERAQSRSKAIAEGSRLFALARRLTAGAHWKSAQARIHAKREAPRRVIQMIAPQIGGATAAEKP
jgi:hypothetical protein